MWRVGVGGRVAEWALIRKRCVGGTDVHEVFERSIVGGRFLQTCREILGGRKLVVDRGWKRLGSVREGDWSLKRPVRRLVVLGGGGGGCERWG